jgi:Family of unknown function (DUF5682)
MADLPDTRATTVPHLFGIRHHGPGSARSLIAAFETLQPDCVLIEGPPEGDALIAAVTATTMNPPVALLSYCPDDMKLATYHPFAVFSPEWQALTWAQQHQVPVRFIDLAMGHRFALEKARRDERENAGTTEIAHETSLDTTPNVELVVEAINDQGIDAAYDPLDWLAKAAGYADGESWWNHMVEERGDGEELFAAIAEAMAVIREEAPVRAKDAFDVRLENLREATMRQQMRLAIKENFQRIAIVCGAWHVSALQAKVAAKDDAALLKGLARLKVATTWVPWTYRLLTQSSGYGAGVHSPGWYQHIWDFASSDVNDRAVNKRAVNKRAVGWLARVAAAMRARELDCSSAHLIEAARLADTLAAMRARPQPGLDELHEATRTVMMMGDESVLQFINNALLVGNVMGSVPSDVPTVPLQRDLEQLQKTLRLKAEATQRTLDLDLRQPNDLARSHLLHRLRLLGIPWGELSRAGRSARGTFHEIWTLQWEPAFAINIIEASRWGQTVAEAASMVAIDQAREAGSLAVLSELTDQVLLADLEDAIPVVTDALKNRAALSGDALQLLAALPALANVYRYGNVRQTASALVVHVLDSLITRAAIALPLAACGIADDAAETLREKILAAHAAIGLRRDEEKSADWQQALAQITAIASTHELINGLASRLLLDAGVRSADDIAMALSLHLSQGAEPAKAAAWLEGFLNRNAQVLLHDAVVWQLVNNWLAQLTDQHFNSVLPLVRRTFSAFATNDRHDLGQRARQAISGAATSAAATTAPAWDPVRAVLPVPFLQQILGLKNDR